MNARRGARERRRVLWLLMGGSCCAAACAAIWTVAGGGESRPAGFSHATHVPLHDEGCVACHPAALASREARDDLLPSRELCRDCHDPDDPQDAYALVGREASPPAAAPAAMIRFDHRRHLALPGVGCAACHAAPGREGSAAEPPRPAGISCNACHDGERGSRQCADCHEADVASRPRDHASDWTEEHAGLLRAGGARDCGHCHAAGDCGECHFTGGLMTAELEPFEYSGAHVPSASSGKLIAGMRVHDPNYRFLHALDAETKTTDCASCHEGLRDCASCHAERSPGGAPLHRPRWHGGADWGTIAGGVGSGGGRHGELVRRDSEGCAACHDVTGSDPTCLRCHMDLDGVRGTDPRFHGDGRPPGASGGLDFHGDVGSVCYACHRRGAPGEGFCSYCHDERDD